MNDDRTVDADDSTMDELRRLAAEAKAAHAPADHTIEADDTTLDELRRFAEEAKRQAAAAAPADVPADRTVDADGWVMDELRRYAQEAQDTSAGRAEPTIDLPAPVAGGHRPPPAPDQLPPLAPSPPAEPAAAPVAAPPAVTDDLTVVRAEDPPAPVVLPAASSHEGEAWRPPPRMVMPTEPEKHVHVHHGPWKTVSIVLGGLVVALVAFVAFSVLRGGGEEQPSDGTTPDSTVDGLSGEGGSGGG